MNVICKPPVPYSRPGTKNDVDISDVQRYYLIDISEFMTDTELEFNSFGCSGNIIIVYLKKKF